VSQSPVQADVATDERTQIRWVLEHCQTIAIVGLSSNPYKDSYIVAHHLHRKGYELIPVNPTATTILERRVFPTLSALPADVAERVQLVLIFRPSDEVPQIVDTALASLPNLQAIWTQKGIVHEAAAARARAAGRIVIQDRCIRTQHLFAKFGRPA
jgi:predicted CoA-binding protein